LVDIATPKSVSMVVSECLTVGASLLLPPLRERLELLQSLLPQGSHLSKGQVSFIFCPKAILINFNLFNLVFFFLENAVECNSDKFGRA
jgi:hypothetical protein